MEKPRYLALSDDELLDYWLEIRDGAVKRIHEVIMHDDKLKGILALNETYTRSLVNIDDIRNSRAHTGKNEIVVRFERIKELEFEKEDDDG